MICENCGKEHDGFYGSGRFCSHSCQASYTNKHRKLTKETKQKISETLHNKRTHKICKCCGSKFYRGEGYNTSKVFCSKKCRDYYFEHLSDFLDIESKNNKISETKIKNKTCNISTQEDKAELLLKTKFNDLVRHYKSEEYPFICDFYVPSRNLYIEYNGSWTHGGKPFEGTDSDLQKLQTWIEKDTKYYDNAIYTWIDLDIRKKYIIEQNKLNFKIFWNLKEIEQYIMDL